jgi:hypothetical protein
MVAAEAAVAAVAAVAVIIVFGFIDCFFGLVVDNLNNQ